MLNQHLLSRSNFLSREVLRFKHTKTSTGTHLIRGAFNYHVVVHQLNG